MATPRVSLAVVMVGLVVVVVVMAGIFVPWILEFANKPPLCEGDPCSVDNGGCQQLCDSNVSCTCGYQTYLDDDRRTCNNLSGFHPGPPGPKASIEDTTEATTPSTTTITKPSTTTSTTSTTTSTTTPTTTPTTTTEEIPKCPPTFDYFNGVCYHVTTNLKKKKKMSWIMARAECMGKGNHSDLASFTSDRDFRSLTQHFSSKLQKGTFWTGAMFNHITKSPLWIHNGDAVAELANERQGHPLLKMYPCGAIMAEDGGFIHEGRQCSETMSQCYVKGERYGYICQLYDNVNLPTRDTCTAESSTDSTTERPADIPTQLTLNVPTEAISTNCPRTFEEINDICYHVTPTADLTRHTHMTWKMAREACLAKGEKSDLVSFASDDEFGELMTRHFSFKLKKGTYWTGATYNVGTKSALWIHNSRPVPKFRGNTDVSCGAISFTVKRATFMHQAMRCNPKHCKPVMKNVGYICQIYN